jgi:hypothetical protein
MMDNIALLIFTFVIFVLATHRIVRFIIRDCLPLISVPRDRILMHTDPTEEDIQNGIKPKGAFLRSIGYLLQCEWCMSIWVSAGLLYGLTFFVNMPVYLAIGWWLAASSLASLISERIEDTYEGCDI